MGVLDVVCCRYETDPSNKPRQNIDAIEVRMMSPYKVTVTGGLKMVFVVLYSEYILFFTGLFVAYVFFSAVGYKKRISIEIAPW
jgi:hypothetical protein